VLQNESFVTGSFARLERAEQVIPDRGADAEVHDLSMVMEMMELLESPPIGDVRKVGTAMVLPVVQEGEMVVAGIQPPSNSCASRKSHRISNLCRRN
jgi:hypothetical protein